MNKPLINITRMAGVEAQLTRIADSLDLLLVYHGVRMPKSLKKVDPAGVNYRTDEETQRDELLREIGRVVPEAVEPEEEE